MVDGKNERWWGEPGSSRRRIAFFLTFGVIFLATLIAFRAVLLPFFLAIVIAYVLAPVVNRVEGIRLFKYTVPRWAAVLMIYMLLLGLLGLTLRLGAPRLITEVERLAKDAPRTIQALEKEWLPRFQKHVDKVVHTYFPPSEADERNKAQGPHPSNTMRIQRSKEGVYDIYMPPSEVDVVKTHSGFRVYVGHRKPPERRNFVDAFGDSFKRALENSGVHASTFLHTAHNFIKRVISGIFAFFITLMLSAYLLITSSKIFDFFRSLVRTEKQANFNQLLARIDRGLAGVVRGQLVICLVNGALSGVGFCLLKLKYWPILTLIATLLSVIPIFGAILSSVPAVLIALQNGVQTAVAAMVWIILIHQLEANVLNPKIMGDAARVHPVLIVFALLAGEHSFGIVGALLAVPILSVTQTFFLHYREIALGPPRYQEQGG